MSSSTVDEVIERINGIVAPDGGRVVLLGSDASEAVVRVRYDMAVNDSCSTCTITPEMLEQFLLESLETHGVQVNRVVVEENEK